MAGPLSGLKVLDMSRVLAGPWCGQLLADLGADVIKIERPKVGDDTRGWGPPFLHDEFGEPSKESAYYLSANRGKKSLAIDITCESGQKIIKSLAAKSDILLENFKVGGLQKYGLDYESLHREFPGLVYASITGFGQTGPLAKRAGYDFMIQAMGGLMSITGEKDGTPNSTPQKVGVAMSDLTTGLYMSVAILAALRHRDQTGEGQHIDLALLDTTVGLLANQNMNYLIGGALPKRMGNAHLNIVPYQVFDTKDGYLILAIGNDRQFKAFCEISGRGYLAEEPQFVTNQARLENRELLVPIVAAILGEKTTAAWLEILESVSVPCGPVNTIAEALNQEQILERDMQFSLPHPVSGEVPQVGNPIKFSATPISYEQAPPTLGQHTDAVLQDIGLTHDQIVELRRHGIID